MMITMYVSRDALLKVTGIAMWAPFVIGSLIFSALKSAAGEHGDGPPTLPVSDCDIR